MGLRRVPFAIDEWYHCYNRGIEKRTIFETEIDSERFLKCLYLCNATENVHVSNLSVTSTEDIVTQPRKHTIVSVGAYCLMPNHFHLLLKEITEGGIVQFMHKLGTAYTMYFNKKYERTGNLLMKPFRSRHVGDDRYFQRVIDYIHCNPTELIDRRWKTGSVRNMDRLEQKLLSYRYSSFPDYAGKRRALAAILSEDGFEIYRTVSAREMLDDAHAYYASISDSGSDSAENIKATP